MYIYVRFKLNVIIFIISIYGKVVVIRSKMFNNIVFWGKVYYICKLCGKIDDNVDFSEYVWIRLVLIYENMDLVL